MNEHNTTPSNLIQEQGKVTPNFDFSALANDTSETEQQDGLITGEQLLLMPYEKMPTLIEPILQRTGIACLAGSSDTGKSTLLRQSVIAIVTGETDFFNILSHLLAHLFAGARIIFFASQSCFSRKANH